MTSTFWKGCERVSWIVSKSESFRNVIEPKVPDALRVIGDEPNLEKRAEAFQNHLRNRLSRRIKLYSTQPADIVYFGGTVNNRKEFEFLSEILDESRVQHRRRMFIDDFASSTYSASKAPKTLIDSILKDAGAFAAQEGIERAHLWQLDQYAIKYLNIRASYAVRKESVPRIGVVANDHSPAQVAFKAAMEALGVPVVYLQHAEVSPAFPPLDYFMSILRNEVSLDIYRQAGSVDGEVYILSRNLHNNKFKVVPDTLAVQQERAVVGIYPTSRFGPTNISKIANTLAVNPFVEDFFVKLHPNSSTKLDANESTALRVRTAIPDESHIALVGNSSVATDLLARGIPVFQLFALDELEPDYYGFVAAGLTASVDRVQIATDAFWLGGFYDGTWLSKAAKFDPASAGGQSELRLAVANKLSEKLAIPPSRVGIKLAIARGFERVLRRLGDTLPARDESNSPD